MIFSTGCVLLLAVSMLSCRLGTAEKDAPDLLKTAAATLSGGSFWCLEAAFERLPGVLSVINGYTGGSEKNPTYPDVYTGTTGHVEAVLIEYDPAKISFLRLLHVFWKNINPVQTNGQFSDVGPQYRSIIFFHDDDQQKQAEQSKRDMDNSKRFAAPIMTEIRPFIGFYPAEGLHQDFYKRNPLRYEYYRFGSGRDQFFRKIWGRPPQKQ